MTIKEKILYAVLCFFGCWCGSFILLFNDFLTSFLFFFISFLIFCTGLYFITKKRFNTFCKNLLVFFIGVNFCGLGFCICYMIYTIIHSVLL